MSETDIEKQINGFVGGMYEDMVIDEEMDKNDFVEYVCRMIIENLELEQLSKLFFKKYDESREDIDYVKYLISYKLNEKISS